MQVFSREGKTGQLVYGSGIIPILASALPQAEIPNGRRMLLAPLPQCILKALTKSGILHSSSVATPAQTPLLRRLIQPTSLGLENATPYQIWYNI